MLSGYDSQKIEKIARTLFERMTDRSWEAAHRNVRNEYRDHAWNAYRMYFALQVVEELLPDPKHCKICGREMASPETPMSPPDRMVLAINPALDCGGDCLACVQEIEQEGMECSQP